MRILTYNIRAGRGMDLSPALERQAAAIRALVDAGEYPPNLLAK